MACPCKTEDALTNYLVDITQHVQEAVQSVTQVPRFHLYHFSTLELPKEKAIHKRKAACKCSSSNNVNTGSGSQRVKKFNLNIYKFHAMGDYVWLIKLFGTTDSFTSQMVG
jgi:hypothetical protein